MGDDVFIYTQDYYCGNCRALRPRYAVWLDRETLPRDGICGHRMVYQNTIPLATRYRPPWRWPRELRNRRRARILGQRRINNSTTEEP